MIKTRRNKQPGIGEVYFSRRGVWRLMIDNRMLACDMQCRIVLQQSTLRQTRSAKSTLHGLTAADLYQKSQLDSCSWRQWMVVTSVVWRIVLREPSTTRPDALSRGRKTPHQPLLLLLLLLIIIIIIIIIRAQINETVMLLTPDDNQRRRCAAAKQTVRILLLVLTIILTSVSHVGWPSRAMRLNMSDKIRAVDPTCLSVCLTFWPGDLTHLADLWPNDPTWHGSWSHYSKWKPCGLVNQLINFKQNFLRCNSIEV